MEREKHTQFVKSQIVGGMTKTSSIMAAESLGVPVFQLVEFLTKSEERAMNDLTTAALMMWYLTGTDIESDNGFANSNKLMQIGDNDAGRI